jgi:hypothetical protein
MGSSYNLFEGIEIHHGRKINVETRSGWCVQWISMDLLKGVVDKYIMVLP